MITKAKLNNWKKEGKDTKIVTYYPTKYLALKIVSKKVNFRFLFLVNDIEDQV